MRDNDSTAQNSTNAQHPPTHQDFHWLNGSLQNTTHGNLLEATLDITTGVHTCLQLFYSSQLEHAANRDADDGKTAPPAVSLVMADQLIRLAIAASGLLRDEVKRQMEALN